MVMKVDGFSHTRLEIGHEHRYLDSAQRSWASLAHPVRPTLRCSSVASCLDASVASCLEATAVLARPLCTLAAARKGVEAP